MPTRYPRINSRKNRPTHDVPAIRPTPYEAPESGLHTLRATRVPAHHGPHPWQSAAAGSHSAGSPATGASLDSARPRCDHVAERSARPVSETRGKWSPRRRDAASCSSSPVSGWRGSRCPASAGASAVASAAACARRRRAPRPHAPVLLLRASGHDEPLATLPAPPVQRLATRARAHPRPEPVLVLPLAIVRVVCRFSHSPVNRLVSCSSGAREYKRPVRPRSTGCMFAIVTDRWPGGWVVGQSIHHRRLRTR